MPTPAETTSPTPSSTQPAPKRHWLGLTLLWLVGGLLALIFVGVLGTAVALAVAYPNLPDVSALTNYRPKLPMRVFTAEGDLIGEFGEERRSLVPIKEIPADLKHAVLAIEDARFYEHGGVDYVGVVRAGLANLGKFKSQGASTITMQVARNVYLSSEKTYTRKIYEILLTHKLEQALSKDQILEVYLNQIYLGHRAYGFASASEVYFGKPLKDISLAEAAMLAGLPKAPSAYNPITNFKRARIRQLYILDRMVETGYITPEQAEAAKAQQLVIKSARRDQGVRAEYVAEMVRQLMFAQYGDAIYTRGLNVHTTLSGVQQVAAYKSLRKALIDFDHRQAYRGPEKFIELPASQSDVDDMIDDIMTEHPDEGEYLTALVLEASPRKLVVTRGDEPITISGEGLRMVQGALSDKASAQIKIRRGALVRVMANSRNGYEVVQVPEVEGALVAMDPRSGAIKALVGGFDFNKSKFNHVTQAWRQPGSSFKPFIYSAALEKGFTPTTVIMDGPLYYDGSVTGGKPWEPKNYDGGFEGPMNMRRALARSKNTVSVRILESIGPSYGQEWVTRFGFDADKHPPYLTMALGAGSVTPMQIAAGFSVFANGGYRVNPMLITQVTDQQGKPLAQPAPKALDDGSRAIDARNAFIMSSLLNEVTKTGTAARAQSALGRSDLYGKTGTTNDSQDAWFVGFQPTLAAAVWIGYDTPRKLGDRETGGGLSLPVWIQFMQTALKGVPVAQLAVPEGVVNSGGEWYYEEYPRGGGVRSLGVPVRPSGGGSYGGGEDAPDAVDSQERSQILDSFKGPSETAQ